MSSYQYQIDITHHITHDRSQTRILLFFLTRLLIRALTLTPHSFSDHHLSLYLSLYLSLPLFIPRRKVSPILHTFLAFLTQVLLYCNKIIIVLLINLPSIISKPKTQNPKPTTHPSIHPSHPPISTSRPTKQAR